MKTQRSKNLVEWLRTFSRDRLNSNLMDSRRLISPHVILEFGNKGILGLFVPERQGGLGFTFQECADVLQQVAAIDLNLAAFIGINNFLGIYPILKFGSDQYREELIPKLATGRMLASFAITETSSGSDPLTMNTTATQTNGGAWVLNGSKNWIGSAGWAGVINVVAKERKFDGTPAGISAFAIKEGTPGLKIGPEAMTMGMRGLVQNAIFLDNAPIVHEALLGQSAQGRELAYEIMNVTRFFLGASAVGGLKRFLQISTKYAATRKVSTGFLIDQPITRIRLTDLLNCTLALESLVQFIGRKMDEDIALVSQDLFLTCKILGSEFLWAAADITMQTLGGRGYIEANGVAQMFRDARLIRIFEGATEALEVHLGSIFALNPEKAIALSLLLKGEDTVLNSFSADIIRLKKILKEKKESPERHAVHEKLLFNALCGKIAAFAILAAVHEVMPNDVSTKERVSRWIKFKYETELEIATRILSDFTFLNGQDLRLETGKFKNSIGNVRQQMLGEDWQFDPLL